MQKEPKLVRARQIPEWDVYDREIAEFAARISGNALAASVDDLAGTKPGPGPSGPGSEVVVEREVEGEEAGGNQRPIGDEL